MTSDPRRLHPAAVASEGLGSLRELVLPALVGVLVTSGGISSLGHAVGRGLLFGLLLAAGSLAMGYVSWRATSYRVSDGTLRLRRGIVRVNEVSIPLGRIQSVDTVRGPVQRLFGVRELRVQAAGGGKDAEIVLSALSDAAVAELGEVLDADSAGMRAAGPAGPTRRLGPGALLAGALTSGQLGVILPLVAGAGQFGDELLGSSPGDVGGSGIVPDALGEVALFLAAIAGIAWLLSILGAIVAFAGFRVTRDGDRLRIRRGLLQRREASVPVARVHAVRLVEGLLRQPFGLAQLRIETAGYAEEASAARTLFPLLRRSETAAFLAEILPELAGSPGALERPPARARRRYLLPPGLAGLGAGVVPALLLAGEGAVAAAPLAAGALLGCAYGLARHGAAGWRLDGALVTVRQRRFARVTLVAGRRRLQERSLAQNPFQRRASLATLEIAVASGARAEVAHIDAPLAATLLDRLRP